jgi:hypothetical protein
MGNLKTKQLMPEKPTVVRAMGFVLCTLAGKDAFHIPGFHEHSLTEILPSPEILLPLSLLSLQV